MLTTWPIATAASDPAAPADSLGAPMARPLDAAPPVNHAGTPAAESRLDLTSALTAPLASDSPPEIVLLLKDARAGGRGTGSSAPAGGGNPSGSDGPYTPYVGIGDSLSNAPYRTATPTVSRLSAGDTVPADQGYAGVDVSVSSQTSLSLRYRALAPEDDPELKPSNVGNLTHNLEVGLQIGF